MHTKVKRVISEERFASLITCKFHSCLIIHIDGLSLSYTTVCMHLENGKLLVTPNYKNIKTIFVCVFVTGHYIPTF